MKAKTYTILERAVYEGFKLGWNRAHKHSDQPNELQVESEVVSNILNAIEEVFSFEDEK